MARLDDLKNQVAQNTTVTQSALDLINGFAKRLDDGIAAAVSAGADAGELADLTALSAQIKASDDALAAAVTNATPAAKAPAEQKAAADAAAQPQPPAPTDPKSPALPAPPTP